MPLLSVVPLAACAAAGGGPDEPSQAPPGFWEHWGDGRAEVSGFELVQPRYGELRKGEAVMVFVTETFTAAQRVKSDGGHDDEFPVLHWNEVRDFQTGIYDYHALTSSFVRLDGALPRGQPTKVSFSMQEWCGHVFEQLLVGPDAAAHTRHSYFDGEGDEAGQVDLPAGGVFADAFPVLVRGLAGELLPPGGSREVPWLPRLIDARLAHRPIEWTRATIARSAAPERLDTALGALEADRWTVDVAGGGQATFWVESAAPRRLLRWSRSDGDEGVVRGATRLAYWTRNHEGDEALRAELGLAAR